MVPPPPPNGVNGFCIRRIPHGVKMVLFNMQQNKGSRVDISSNSCHETVTSTVTLIILMSKAYCKRQFHVVIPHFPRAAAAGLQKALGFIPLVKSIHF